MQSQTYSRPSPHLTKGAPIRALLLDDSKFDRARIRRLSDQAGLNIQLDEVDTLSGMKSVVEDAQYDLFLIDYRLPVGDGFKALQMLREDPRHDTAGNILITGSPALSTTVNAMRNGYHDVLSKDDMTASHLMAAVRTAVTQARRPFQDQQPPTRKDVFDSVHEAMAHPALHAYLGKIVSEHISAAQTTQVSEFDPEEEGFFDVDEFVFHT